MDEILQIGAVRVDYLGGPVTDTLEDAIETLRRRSRDNGRTAHVVGRLSQGWIYFRDTLAAAFAAAIPLRHFYIEKARRTISVKRTHDGP